MFKSSSLTTTVFISLLSLCGSSIYADQTSEDYYPQSGPYADLSAGPTVTNNNLLGIEVNSFSGATLNASLGYQFNPYFAVEAGYNPFLLRQGKYLNGAVAATKLILPFGQQQRMHLFAKLGAIGLLSSKDSAATIFAGVGAGYRVTQRLDFNMQLQGAIAGFVNIGTLSAGITYHF